MPTDFKTLDIWKEAHQLTLDTYKLVSKFPREEQYGLTSQLKRAITSIELNISEGCGRRTNKDFVSFLYNAMGSCKEVENLFMLAKDLDFIDITDYNAFNARIQSIGKMLTRFIQARQERDSNGGV